MRGARRSGEVKRCRAGLIPADAGSTDGHRWHSVLCGAHPRGCGEHRVPDDGLHESPGSSPRMRGAPETPPGEFGPDGLIPADAGSTWPVRAAHPGRWAHPRGCGEHYPLAGDALAFRGSSPRMRGAPGQRIAGLHGVGLIPADAGSTLVDLGKRYLIRPFGITSRCWRAAGSPFGICWRCSSRVEAPVSRVVHQDLDGASVGHHRSQLVSIHACAP